MATGSVCWGMYDGVAKQATQIPCGTSGQASRWCCGQNDRCLQDSICFYNSPSNVAGGYYVGGCVDKSFTDSACSRFCGRSCTSFPASTSILWRRRLNVYPGDNQSQDIVYNYTTRLWACCNTPYGDPTCMDPGNETMEAPPPEVLRMGTTTSALTFVSTTTLFGPGSHSSRSYAVTISDPSDSSPIYRSTVGLTPRSSTNPTLSTTSSSFYSTSSSISSSTFTSSSKDPITTSVTTTSLASSPQPTGPISLPSTSSNQSPYTPITSEHAPQATPTSPSASGNPSPGTTFGAKAAIGTFMAFLALVVIGIIITCIKRSRKRQSRHLTLNFAPHMIPNSFTHQVEFRDPERLRELGVRSPAEMQETLRSYANMDEPVMELGISRPSTGLRSWRSAPPTLRPNLAAG